MTFQFSKSQKEIQKAAREFAKGEFDKALGIEREREGAFPGAIRDKAAELGFLGIHYPETYDGGGLGILEHVILAEEFCKKDSSLGASLMLSGYGSECLLRFGSAGLKDKFLPKIADGAILSGAAFSETESGYGFSGIETTAEQKEGRWIVNGRKRHVINGGEAGIYIVLCKTEARDASDNGISMILVEADTKGVSVSDKKNRLGMRMVATTDLHFKDAAVPFDHLVGRENSGIRQAQAFLNESRILAAAMALGTARGAFDRALDYVKQRVQFKRKIGQFQVTRHKLAEMAVQIEQAAAATFNCALTFDPGKSDGIMSAAAKLSACKTALNVSGEAIQLLGGYGYMTEYEVEKFYRDAKTLDIFEGNAGRLKDEISAGIIGKIR